MANNITSVGEEKDYRETINPANYFIYEIANRVYKQLGTGHNEFIYHRAMEAELRSRGIHYETERRVIIRYQDMNKQIYSLGEERIDLLLNHTIVELKASVGSPKEAEINQVYKYKRELDKEGVVICQYGIVINFPQPGNKPAKEEIDFIEIIFG